MTKRKYLKTTKDVRFWWERTPWGTRDLMAQIEPHEPVNVAYIEKCDSGWFACLNDKAHPTLKAAKRHAEEQLGLVCDD